MSNKQPQWRPKLDKMGRVDFSLMRTFACQSSEEEFLEIFKHPVLFGSHTIQFRKWDVEYYSDHLIFPLLLKHMRYPKAFSLGRETSNRLVIRDYSVSLHHLDIWYEEGAFFVQDRNSITGTSVNGRALFAEDEKEIYGGDKIRAGQFTLQLMYAEELYQLLTRGNKEEEAVEEVTEPTPDEKTQKRIDNVVKVLNQLPFFEAFTDYEKRYLAERDTFLYGIKKGAFLIREGEESQNLFFLLNGKAAVLQKGQQKPLALLKPGDVVGEVTFLIGDRRTTSVRTLQDMYVLSLAPDTMPQLSADIRERIKDRLLLHLLQKIHRQEKQLQRLSIPPTPASDKVSTIHPPPQLTETSLRPLLDRSPLLEHFTEEEKHKLCQVVSHCKYYQPGEKIVTQGMQGKLFFLLLAGRATITQDQQPKQIIATLQAGEGFGEQAWLPGYRRAANVIAQDPCLVMLIGPKLLAYLGILSREKLKDKVLQKLAHRLVSNNQRLRERA
ncbi:cyclic nucleotide-binding domain-containing protein [Magnetococcales bacterium HHB-1]